MSLTFFKNKKPDTRMIEYDQAVIRLGLEKSALEGDVDEKKREFENLKVALDHIRAIFLQRFDKLSEKEKKEVQEKMTVLSGIDERIIGNERMIDHLVEKQREIQEQTAGEEKKLVALSSSLLEAEGRKKVIEGELQKLYEDREVKISGTSLAKLELTAAKEKLDKIRSEVIEAANQRAVIDAAVNKKNQELEELNNIITVLQESNKQGLELVASFDGEKKRLQEKEDFLKRKEADLLIYENRLKKHCTRVGYDVKMVFK